MKKIVAATVLTGKAAFQAAVFAAIVTAVASQEWKVWPCYGGGYVQNVVIAPSNPRVWYAYVDVGGPYRSDDAPRGCGGVDEGQSRREKGGGSGEGTSSSVHDRVSDGCARIVGCRSAE